MTNHFQSLHVQSQYQDVESLDSEFKQLVRNLPPQFRMLDPDKSFDSSWSFIFVSLLASRSPLDWHCLFFFRGPMAVCESILHLHGNLTFHYHLACVSASTSISWDHMALTKTRRDRGFCENYAQIDMQLPEPLVSKPPWRISSLSVILSWVRLRISRVSRTDDRNYLIRDKRSRLIVPSSSKRCSGALSGNS